MIKQSSHKKQEIQHREKKAWLCLGIESTCDDTSIALVRLDLQKKISQKANILALKHAGQEHLQRDYGGVVPELAARAHVQKLGTLLQEVISQDHFDIQSLDGIAVAGGPGLIGGLMAGVMMGKALAMEWQCPFVAVNHLEAHALTVRLTHQTSFPYLFLLISGGHTSLIAIQDYRRYTILGSSRDDAAGEAFDKGARLLGLSPPNGIELEKCAAKGQHDRWCFPRPLFKTKECDFSFSGLKTSLGQTIRKYVAQHGTLEKERCHMAASFQQAIIDCLIDRTVRGMKKYENIMGKGQRCLVVAGGVASNGLLRSAIKCVAKEHGYHCVIPPVDLCTDNGAMIAWCGIEALMAGETTPLDFVPRARWSLAEVL